MSFSDMMSSGRGPGVIGMVMALIVLLGFGVLFMFAFDEGFQGEDQSIESVIRNQGKDIKDFQSRIESGQKSLELAPGRTAAAKELSRLKSESAALQEKITTLGQSVEGGKTAITQTKESFEGYKDQYRAFVRGKAKGTNLDELKIADGTTYTKVSIRKVDAVGLLIIHEAGQKRVDYEGLPAEMKDYYQFDPVQKADLLQQESSAHGALADAVDKQNQAAEEAAAVKRAGDEEQAKVDAAAKIELNKSRIKDFKDQLKSLDREMELEKKKKLANTDSIRNRMAAARKALDQLESENRKLEAKL
jgi:hypothetical protein